MAYQGYTTFKAQAEDGILTVTFDFGTVNVQGQEMLADLNGLAMRLERDRDIKVVVFQSANPEVWVCHYDTNLLKDMSTEAVSREEAKLLDLQVVLERISKLPQATIAKLEGFARGGGHEFALACDMRFAARGKYKFMQMEVGMGILPCGGGASRMARQVGLGRALEIVLSARDFDADEAEAYGTINKALEPDEIGEYVDTLAKRISKFPAESINACKQAVYESIDKPIDEALKAEAYWLYQATSKTPAVKRFQIADEQGLEHDMENQRNWETLVMNVQDIK
ncbi:MULTISPECIES: enoyl-CoA hydratase/isomerase family protein [Vibrio]|uniref:Enoyl-CoA hydratase/isomerase family protein n=1 Tax=Vibrio splendidus TaxID=29497 RepID=A0ABD5A7Q0_VIBSP|nr:MULTISPECIES: enoyl-CoA hydratase/isomerase family protein [Vibrio]EAP95484.1 enoyl-CoA hydratase/isomerase family protein [Vibrio splendidus 12B01]MCK8070389.1 enoyl-CoA hydratase/isomerase family protein [Vibrio sp. 1CM23M]MCW4442990.1 enoyl-CoA hydratase/isomerase family protein [Vibrio splendidus]MCY9862778.1 enoyl-CoA hydratase/isomerase family protein [Vibrio coralliirubri]MDH5902276.1 enoyl-CoA hydratase/isomerase family protein [Vibrio splendidus]